MEENVITKLPPRERRGIVVVDREGALAEILALVDLYREYGGPERRLSRLVQEIGALADALEKGAPGYVLRHIVAQCIAWIEAGRATRR